MSRKLTIAFLCRFPTLSESFIVNQITGLLDSGCTVRIFSSPLERPCVQHRDVEKYDLLRLVKYPARLPKSKVLSQFAAIAMIAKAFLRKPIITLRSVVIFLRRYRNMAPFTFFDWVTPFVLGDFDIIHCHFGPNGLRAMCLKEIGLASKLVTTFHGYDVTAYVKSNGKEVYSELFECGDIFTYNSNSTRKILLKLGAPAERMVKLPMGIYTDKIHFAERTISQGEQINILSVGRLVEMKGREYAIRAIAKIIGKYPHVRYKIVGDGPLRDSLQQLIDDLGVGDSVQLLGGISSEKLGELYRSTHIFLHPSVTASSGNMEGQGVVLAEAQAFGIPIVATQADAFVDSVIDGESGFLVAEKDVDALVDRISFLVENPQVWSAMGKSGRKFVEESFDSKKLNRQLIDIYEKLLE